MNKKIVLKSLYTLIYLFLIIAHLNNQLLHSFYKHI